MGIQKIEELTREWNSVTWKVIELKNLGLGEIRKLFKETYEIIEEYSTEKLIPKELSGLLLEMHDFGWWVSDLDDTPLHFLYQEIVHLINRLNKYFLTRDANTKEIENIIERIVE